MSTITFHHQILHIEVRRGRPKSFFNHERHEKARTLGTTHIQGSSLATRHGGGVVSIDDSDIHYYLSGKSMNASYIDGHVSKLLRTDWVYQTSGIQRDLLRRGYDNNFSL